MKITLLALILTSPLTFASPKYSGVRLKEAQAVLAAQEVNNLLDVIKKSRSLACETMTPDDVVVTVGTSGASDTFEADFGCNDANGGANVQRVDFQGSVSVANGSDVEVTSMTIEASE